MSTTSSKVSVIDLQRTNTTVVRNLIDNPNYSEDIFGITNVTLTFNGDISDTELETGDFLTFTDGSDTRRNHHGPEHFHQQGQGQGSVLQCHHDPDCPRRPRPPGSWNPEGHYPTGSSFVPETNNNGSVYIKWISRLFLFENACDGMELKLGPSTTTPMISRFTIIPVTSVRR